MPLKYAETRLLVNEYFSISSGKMGKLPDTRNERTIRRMYHNFIRELGTPGQMKLGAIMCV